MKILRKVWRRVDTFYYDVKNFLQNLPHFLRMAWRWRSWDYGYTIDVFCITLDKLGDTLIKHGDSVNHVRDGRRAKTAARLLSIAYKEETPETLVALIKKGSMYRRLCRRESSGVSEVYYDKMYTIISKKYDKIEADRKEYAWKYIHKHIERWWE